MARKEKAEKDVKRRASGGNLYNAKGAPEESEIKAKSDGFKKGGKVERRKEGGRVEGEKAKERLDRPGRYARGGSPYSSGHNVTPMSSAACGHEGEKPGRMP